MTLITLKRLLENIVQVGSVSETKNNEGKALARVILNNLDDNKRVTGFLPVVSFANSFGKVFFPLRVNEQVLVIRPFGSDKSGFIIRSIFNRKCKEPNGSNEHTAIIEFEDGTRISYDSKQSDLTVYAVKTINVICTDAYVKASNQAKVETPKLEVISEDILFKASETVFDSNVTVKKGFIGQGSFAMTNENGDSSGEALFNMKIKARKDIKTEGDFVDSRGNISTHTNGSYTRD